MDDGRAEGGSPLLCFFIGCSVWRLQIAETSGFFSDFRHIKVFILFSVANRPSSRI